MNILGNMLNEAKVLSIYCLRSFDQAFLSLQRNQEGKLHFWIANSMGNPIGDRSFQNLGVFLLKNKENDEYETRMSMKIKKRDKERRNN